MKTRNYFYLHRSKYFSKINKIFHCRTVSPQHLLSLSGNNKIYCLVFSIIIIFSALAAFSQNEGTASSEQSGDIVSIESPPDYSNITLNEIRKKEQDISNLLDQINDIIMKINATPSSRAKKALEDQMNQLKESLQKEMQEYSAMVSSYNSQLSTTVIPTAPPTGNPAALNEIELKNREKELISLTDNINQKVAMANRETTEEGKKAYIDQIEQLKNQFQIKKAQYFKLVSEYNKQIISSMQLDQAQGQASETNSPE